MWKFKNFIQISDPRRIEEYSKDIRRYCPRLTDKEFKGLYIQKNEESLYTDYQLLRVELKSGVKLFGFHARGDFRPISSYGSTFNDLNKVSNLEINNVDFAVKYISIRIRFELFRLIREYRKSKDDKSQNGDGLSDLLDQNEEGESEWRISEILTEKKDLFTIADQFEVKELLNSIKNIIHPPKAERISNGESKRNSENGQEESTFKIKLFTVLGVKSQGYLIYLDIEITTKGIIKACRFEIKKKFSLKTDSISKIHSTIRIQPVLMDLKWKLVQAEIAVNLKKKFTETKNNNESLLRIANLTFYENYQLLEVLIPEGNDRIVMMKRGYALIPKNKDGKIIGSEIKILNGTSPVIHNINSEDNELILNEDTINDYLRFFCWAVHSDEGSFSIPAHAFEIPFTSISSKEKKEELNEINYSIKKVDKEEAEKLEFPKIGEDYFKRKTYLFYSNALYQGWFAIYKSGKIDMVHDDPLFTNLEFRSEKYGSNNLVILSTTIPIKGKRPEPKHFYQSEQLSVNKKSTISNIKFYEEWKNKGHINGIKVKDKIVIDDSILDK